VRAIRCAGDDAAALPGHDAVLSPLGRSGSDATDMLLADVAAT